MHHPLPGTQNIVFVFFLYSFCILVVLLVLFPIHVVLHSCHPPLLLVHSILLHTKLSSHPTPTSLSARVTAGHTSLRYCSLYLGNNTAKLLSSSRPLGLSSFLKGSTRQWSMPSWSHGLGFLCCVADGGVDEMVCGCGVWTEGLQCLVCTAMVLL